MRQNHTGQDCLFDQFAQYRARPEMRVMPFLMDDHIDLLDLFATDLDRSALNDTG